jgi:hypothetical protein
MSMQIFDARMFEAAQTFKASGKVSSYKEFYEGIGFERRNVYNVRQQTQHFKSEHILEACQVYGINANWIFGLDNKMFRANNPVNRTPRKVKKAIRKRLKVRG